MKNTKVSLILISVSMIILVFTGCGMQYTTKTPMNNTNTTTNQTNKSISTATFKTSYSNTLKELVTANTITNTQSKKVLAAITKNMSQDSATNSSNAATPNTGTTNQIKTTNNTNVVNGLTSLVKSKVITQVQSDTIYQKIQMNLENIQINK